MFIFKATSTNNLIRPSLRTLLKYHCTFLQHRTAILQSQYHLKGPQNNLVTRNIKKLVSDQLQHIENLQKKLDHARTSLLQPEQTPIEKNKKQTQINNKNTLEEYLELYSHLMRVVEKCQLNNEWIYKLISWYNMLPFYKSLVERFIDANSEQLLVLIPCLEVMTYQWNNPYGIIDQNLFKQQNISNFYKRLQESNFNLRTIRKIENILKVPVNFRKRQFFKEYFHNNIDELLRYLQISEEYSLNDIIWLLHAYVRNMNDSEQVIAKLERHLITHRYSLDKEEINMLMNTYELKGNINRGIYDLFIKPHILKEKMAKIEDLIEMVKFTVNSESQDMTLLKQLYELIAVKYNSTKIPNSRHTYILHLYTHYLLIKGYKIKLPPTLEKELTAFCRQRAEGRENVVTILNSKNYGDRLGKKHKFKSACLTVPNKVVRQFQATTLSPFQHQFGQKVKQLDLKSYKIYEKPVFCCFQLDYFLVHVSKPEFIDVQIEGIQYVFTSGRMTRDRQIRDQILQHYNLKINHLNYNLYKSGKLDQDEVLMNKNFRNK